MINVSNLSVSAPQNRVARRKTGYPSSTDYLFIAKREGEKEKILLFILYKPSCRHSNMGEEECRLLDS